MQKTSSQGCRYFSVYKRCKFGEYCAFDHSAPIDPILEEIKILNDRMTTLEKQVIDKNDEIKALMKNLEKALCSLKPSPEVFPASSASLPCNLSSTKSNFTMVSIAEPSITSAADNSSERNIRQLDGHGHADEAQEADVYEHQGDDDNEWINPHPITGVWICRCCCYAHSYATEEDLRKHHNTLTIEYDDCNVCYPWHVLS